MDAATSQATDKRAKDTAKPRKPRTLPEPMARRKWKPGESGNPKGRAPGITTYTACVKGAVFDALNLFSGTMKITELVDDGKGGQETKEKKIAVVGAQGFFQKLSQEKPIEFASAVMRFIPREIVSTGRNSLAIAIVPPDEMEAIRAEVDAAKREILARESGTVIDAEFDGRKFVALADHSPAVDVLAADPPLAPSIDSQPPISEPIPQPAIPADRQSPIVAPLAAAGPAQSRMPSTPPRIDG